MRALSFDASRCEIVLFWQRLSKLRTLTLAHVKLDSSQCLASAEQITRLDIRDTKLGEVKGLSALSALRELSLPPGLRALGPLGALTTLVRLDLRGSKASDLSPLATLVNLEHLTLKGAAEVTDLSALKGLGALVYLDLSATGVSSMKWAKRLTSLQTLQLRDTTVADLRPLTRLEALTTIDLAGTPIKRLPDLRRLVALETLLLSDTGIKKVAGLKRNPTLKLLEIVGTEVSDEQVEKLQEALPECVIER